MFLIIYTLTELQTGLNLCNYRNPTLPWLPLIYAIATMQNKENVENLSQYYVAKYITTNLFILVQFCCTLLASVNGTE